MIFRQPRERRDLWAMATMSDDEMVEEQVRREMGKVNNEATAHHDDDSSLRVA